MAAKDKPASRTSGLASLAALRDKLPEGPAAASRSVVAPSAPEPKGKEPALLAGKIVVSRSKKGRGGRTVTTVSGLTGSAAELEALALDLRRALGCGASVEDGIIVVQGEQQPRIRAFLEGRGAKRIVIGA